MAVGPDDLVFERPGQPDDEAPADTVEDTFRVDGEPVRVEIRAEETTIAYASGSERSLPTEELRFCPECMKDGSYPLTDGAGGVCPEHDAPLLPFSLEDYERFKLLHQYEMGYGRL